MGNSKKIQNIEEFHKILTNHLDSVVHSAAPYYLKYPYLDLMIEKPISVIQYNDIMKAKKNTGNALFITQAMNLLLGNYEEYLIASKDVPDPWKSPVKDIDLFKTLMGRKTSNLLSSCFAFTEHTKKLYHQIKSSPSFGSLKCKYVTESCSILEEVRNYAQHTGLPIHQMQIDGNTFNISVMYWATIIFTG